MRRRLMSAVWVTTAIMYVIAAAAAQTHRDFFRTWTIDAAKSDFDGTETFHFDGFRNVLATLSVKSR